RGRLLFERDANTVVRQEPVKQSGADDRECQDAARGPEQNAADHRRESSMPELPDVELYIGALRPRVVGQTIRAVRLAAPFLLRSVEPALASARGRAGAGVAARGE